MKKEITITLDDNHFNVKTTEEITIIDALGMIELARDSFLHGKKPPESEVVNE